MLADRQLRCFEKQCLVACERQGRVRRLGAEPATAPQEVGLASARRSRRSRVLAARDVVRADVGQEIVRERETRAPGYQRADNAEHPCRHLRTAHVRRKSATSRALQWVHGMATMWLRAWC